MLTSQDLNQIGKLIHDSEERLSKKIDNISTQILEYTNDVRDAHEEWLHNHEKRISKLEDNSYLIRDKNRG